jgi:predicted MPP superfamily phosphohydrolase
LETTLASSALVIAPYMLAFSIGYWVVAPTPYLNLSKKSLKHLSKTDILHLSQAIKQGKFSIFLLIISKENLVAIQLFKTEQKFYYFNEGKECDFVIKHPI